jgi:hypothetical protein
MPPASSRTWLPVSGCRESVRDNPGRLDLHAVPVDGLAVEVVRQVEAAAAAPGSVGVIIADADVPNVSAALTAAGIGHGVLGADHGDIEHQIDLVPASVAKGLEFDRVIVVEPATIVAAEPDERTGLRRLYVVLTRAVSELDIVHTLPLPEELRAA